MALEHVPRCQHVKVNGVQCGSPALRHRAHCFFHTRSEYERQIAIENNSGKRAFGFPLLEDANSIQVALMKVIQMLGSGALDHKTAGLMLYALQTASYNLRNAKFEPEKPTDVVIDEDTVDLTRMRGAQWSTRDFPPAPAEAQSEPGSEAQSKPPKEARKEAQSEVQSRVQSEAQGDVEREVQGEAQREAPGELAKESSEVVDKELAELICRREQKRNMLQIANDGEPDSPTKAFLRELGVLSEDEKSIKLPEQPEPKAGSSPILRTGSE